MYYLKLGFGFFSMFFNSIAKIVSFLFQPYKRKLYDDKLLGFSERFLLVNAAHEGFVIDGTNSINFQQSTRNLIVHGRVGSGKSTGPLITTLFKLKHSAYLIDPSLELYRTVAAQKKKEGFSIHLINLSEPKHSLRYNCLDYANTHTSRRIIADLLIQAAYPNDKGDSFWRTGAISMLNTLLSLLKTQDKQFQNLANLRYLLQHFRPDGGVVHQLIRQSSKEIQLEFNSLVKGASENTILGIANTAKVAIDFVSDPKIALLTSGQTTFRFDRARDEKALYFISCKESMLRYYSPLISILLTQIMNYLMQGAPGGKPCYLLLEEAGNYSLPLLREQLLLGRKYNCPTMLLFQNAKAQLSYRYGQHEMKAMMEGGIDNHLYLANQSIEVAEELARIIGRNSIGILDAHGKERQHTREVLTATEIRNLPQNKGLFLCGGNRPMMVTMTPYYEQRRYRAYASQTPPSFPSCQQETISFLPFS